MQETLTTPNKYSSTFDAVQSGTYFNAEEGNYVTKKIKNGLNEQAEKNDKRGGQFSVTVGITGGAFLSRRLFIHLNPANITG